MRLYFWLLCLGMIVIQCLTNSVQTVRDLETFYKHGISNKKPYWAKKFFENHLYIIF